MRPRRVAAVALLVLSTATCVQAQEGERFPDFTAPVVDAADVVPDDVEERVNQTLNAYQQASTNQIAVAVIETTGDASLEDYTIDLARRWGVGEAEKDNGVLLLIAVEDRRLRIEVGSGLEGELTDLESGRIVREHITPRLREGDYGGAVEAGVTAVRQAIGGELAPQPVEEPGGGEPSVRFPFPALLFVMFFLVPMLFRGLGRRGYRRRRGWGGWMAPILIGGMLGGRGGRGGGFGGSGGGFSGGGGGGFSGGGASGSW